MTTYQLVPAFDNKTAVVRKQCSHCKRYNDPNQHTCFSCKKRMGTAAKAQETTSKTIF